MIYKSFGNRNPTLRDIQKKTRLSALNFTIGLRKAEPAILRAAYAAVTGGAIVSPRSMPIYKAV